MHEIITAWTYSNQPPQRHTSCDSSEKGDATVPPTHKVKQRCASSGTAGYGRPSNPYAMATHSSDNQHPRGKNGTSSVNSETKAPCSQPFTSRDIEKRLNEQAHHKLLPLAFESQCAKFLFMVSAAWPYLTNLHYSALPTVLLVCWKHAQLLLWAPKSWTAGSAMLIQRHAGATRVKVVGCWSAYI